MARLEAGLSLSMHHYVSGVCCMLWINLELAHYVLSESAIPRQLVLNNVS